MLINNAAAMFADREVTPEGLEKTFAINHLAPFILTHLEQTDTHMFSLKE